MKRTILTSILGIAAAMVVNSAQAQGKVNLDNYSNTGAIVTYGSGPSAIGGTTAGAGVYNGSAYNGVAGNVTWTIGIYWALGNVTASVASDPTGVADPSTLGGGLAFLTTTAGSASNDGGVGAGTTFNETTDHGTFITSTGDAVLNGYTSGLATFEVVAFSGTTYANSPYRGHSAAFTLTPATGSSSAPAIGTSSGGMPTFGVLTAGPEPSIFALSGIGAAALMLFRRKK